MQSCGTASEPRNVSISSSSASVSGSSMARGSVRDSVMRLFRRNGSFGTRYDRPPRRSAQPRSCAQTVSRAVVRWPPRFSAYPPPAADAEPMPPPKIKTQAFLANLPLFQRTGSRRDRPHRHAARPNCTCPRGEIVFNKGDPCSGFHARRLRPGEALVRDAAGRREGRRDRRPGTFRSAKR